MPPRKCQAKTPALCHYHGVPQPVLSIKDANKDIDALTNEIVARASNMAEWHELDPLRTRKQELENRVLFFKTKGKDMPTSYVDSINQEISDYRENALKAILGEDSPEWKAYTFNTQDFLNNPENYKQFPSYTNQEKYDPEDTSFGDHYELYKKVESYAKTLGADGAVVVKDPNTVLGELILPYKLHPGQLSPEEKFDLTHTPKFLEAEKLVNTKVSTMKNAVAYRKQLKRERG